MITRAVLRRQLKDIEVALAQLKVSIRKQQLLLRAMGDDAQHSLLKRELSSLRRMEDALRVHLEDRERIKDVLAHAHEKGL